MRRTDRVTRDGCWSGSNLKFGGMGYACSDIGFGTRGATSSPLASSITRILKDSASFELHFRLRVLAVNDFTTAGDFPVFRILRLRQQRAIDTQFHHRPHFGYAVGPNYFLDANELVAFYRH